MSAVDVEVERFGRDLVVPFDEDGEIRVTPTGDLPTQAGRENLAAAVRARLMTSPGELVHRSSYGAGLPDEVETAGTPGGRVRLGARVRLGVLVDDRMGDAKASVARGLPDDPTARDHVTVTLQLMPKGDTAPTAVVFPVAL